MDALVRFLSSLSGYPIPRTTLENIALSAGFEIHNSFGEFLVPEIIESKQCKKAMALVYIWLSNAPNVSQSGISFSLSENERQRLRAQAQKLLDEIGEDEELDTSYGYKGEDL